MKKILLVFLALIYTSSPVVAKINQCEYADKIKKNIFAQKIFKEVQKDFLERINDEYDLTYCSYIDFSIKKVGDSYKAHYMFAIIFKDDDPANKNPAGTSSLLFEGDATLESSGGGTYKVVRTTDVKS
jgi:hypothetical protein